MLQMTLKEIEDNDNIVYNWGHFGNESLKVGSTCWFKCYDDRGCHEIPIEIIEEEQA